MAHAWRASGFFLVSVTAAGLGLAACGGSGPLLSASGPPLSWSGDAASSADGTPPSYTAAQVCGSDTSTYLSELVHGNPLAAKVPYEWGDIVPGGKQILVSGTSDATHLGPSDNPLTHAYGDDLSMDVKLSPSYLGYSRQLGPPDEPAGDMHVEISSGFIPHVPRRSQASASQTWPQLSQFNLTGFQPGFSKPPKGAPVLVMGRWIVDCGHPNYGTELHPMSFVAWTTRQGSTTVARMYDNALRDTQLYSSDSSSPQPLPATFVSEVGAALKGSIYRLSAHEIVAAKAVSPAPWKVCAPQGSSGHTLNARYDLVTRPGVSLEVTPDRTDPCVTLTATVGSGYRSLDPTLRQCVLPWSYLSQIAEQTYGSTIDLQHLIDTFVSSTSARAIVDRDPTTSCADASSGPRVDPSPGGQHVLVDASQPFPFYGVVTVSLS